MNLFGCDCKNCWKKSGANRCQNIGQLKIALVGNPNVGKSVLFNALSGFYAEVSNYPGTTVDISRAYIGEGEIVDTPGAYSIGNYTDDEIVTKNILQTTDLIVNVVSAISLERDLLLTQQLIDMDFPIIVVVNQIDEAKSRGININFSLMEELLDLKVFPAVAIRNQGISEIKKAIENKDYRISRAKTPYIEKLFDNINIPKCDKFCKLVEIESKESENHKERDIIYAQRKEKIAEIQAKVIIENRNKLDALEILGNMLLNPYIGMAIAFIVLFLLYQIIGVFVAGNVVDIFSSWIKENYTPWISGLIDKYIHIAPIKEFLTGEFGILTMTIELVIGILLPLIASFYLFMAVLEDSGYLPRLAVLTDRLLSKIGLNGRAIIPLILGFGCSTMGVLTTRILGSKRERMITTALLSLTIPCSAQIGVLIVLIAAIGGIKTWFFYILTIFTVMVLAGTVLNKLLKGQSTDLLIDIPPMRIPAIANILSKMFFRVINFLKEATPMFIIGTFVVSLFKITGILEFIQKMLSPVVVYLLKMPEEFANIFIMGMIRRDFGSVGLLKMAGLDGNIGVLNDLQIFTAAVVVTLFVPCLAALIVIFKERGAKEASLIWIGSFVISVLTGALLIRLAGLF